LLAYSKLLLTALLRKYAKSVKCPTLLLYGEKDLNVSREETNEIFEHLAGHENYLTKYKRKWVKDVGKFLGEIK